jgi:hypothetical protein
VHATRGVVPIAAPGPTFASHNSLDTSCVSFFRVGRPVTSTLFQRREDRCFDVPSPTDERQYRVAEPLQLPSVQVETTRSRLRLQDVVVAYADTRTPSLALFDDVTATRCSSSTSFLTTDIRCLPRTLFAREVYADAACASAMHIAEVPAQQCNDVYRYAGASFDDFFEIGNPVELVYELRSNGCAPYVPGTATRCAVGTLLMPQQFAATRVVDP